MRLVLIVLSLLLSLPVMAAKSDHLHQFLNHLESYQANFEQYVFNREDGSFASVTGKLYLAQPDKFRWEYSGDEGQLIVGDGSSVWLQDRELEQVTQQIQSIALKGSPAEILLGESNVDDIFFVQQLATVGDQSRYLLVPRDDDTQFARIEMNFDDDVLKELLIVNHFGQESRLVFSDIVMNKTIDDKLFIFQRPRGYDFFEH